MNRELKFEFIFQHKKSKEVIISRAYTIDELINEDRCIDIFSIQEECCTCSCGPLGETNVVECNCDDYYDDFELLSKRQYTGLLDKNNREIYEGDIMAIQIPAGGFWGNINLTKTGEVRYESDHGGYIVEWEYSQHQHHHLLNCDIAFEGEIIGNIYKNK